jgi:hypothetical protein
MIYIRQPPAVVAQLLLADASERPIEPNVEIKRLTDLLLQAGHSIPASEALDRTSFSNLLLHSEHWYSYSGIS